MATTIYLQFCEYHRVNHSYKKRDFFYKFETKNLIFKIEPTRHLSYHSEYGLSYSLVEKTELEEREIAFFENYQTNDKGLDQSRLFRLYISRLAYQIAKNTESFAKAQKELQKINNKIHDQLESLLDIKSL